MSQPYLIVNLVDGCLGVIRMRDTWEDAVNVAVTMAKEQCDTPEDKIREELEADTDFVSPNGDIHVCIAQPESD